MAKKINSFKEFAINELRDTYSAENQALAAYPQMIQSATAPDLKHAFEMHVEQTKTQVERLETIFKKMNENPDGNHCEAMEGLLKEAKESISELEKGPILDAALIASAQRVEHYEIASYGTARTFAHHMGDTEAVQLLEESLKEESATDHKLTKIAESVVNPKAAAK